MLFSIIIPSYNNLNYLKLLIESINNNSFYKHQIIVHVNEGSDGTLNYLKKKKIKFTYSPKNIGLCKSVNIAAKLVKTDFVIYAHDDMYFSKKWDYYLLKEIKKYKNTLFYISAISISHSNSIVNYNCGLDYKHFKEEKFLKFCEKHKFNDYQGSHWAPHLVHIDLWNKVGGFSEEFDPGDGSDPDFSMKLWNHGVRSFKTLSNFKVYHFGSKTIRNKNFIKNKGKKIFLLKWGITPKFFREYYLKDNSNTFYLGFLRDPKINLTFLYYHIIIKVNFLYLKFIQLFNKIILNK